MGKIKSDKLHVQGIEVGIYTEDYRNEIISLTDIARYRNKTEAGLNRFVMTPSKWVELTGAVGIVTKAEMKNNTI